MDNEKKRKIITLIILTIFFIVGITVTIIYTVNHKTDNDNHNDKLINTFTLHKNTLQNNPDLSYIEKSCQSMYPIKEANSSNY